MRKIIVDKKIEEIYKIIGENIVKLRGKKTQEILSEESNVSRSVISAIENGQSVSLDCLIKIATTLDVAVSDLFPDSMKPTQTIEGRIRKILHEEIPAIYKNEIGKRN